METPRGYQELTGSARGVAAGTRRVGDADPQEELEVTITVRRRPDAPPLPDPASQAQQGSRHLSREEFASQYGSAAADLRRVEEFAVSHGLVVSDVSAGRRTVRVAGTAAQVSAAFAVDLGRYQSERETYRGREGGIHVPAGLADVVEGVFGLDNRQMARPALRSLAGTAQVVSALTPPQVASLYGFPPGKAAGETIGLLEFGGGYQRSDIEAFFRGLGVAMPALTDVSVDGQANSFGGGTDEDVEVTLDIDVAGSVSNGARIAVYFAPWTEAGWVDAVSSAVHDSVNNPSVLSISWGWAESQQAGQVDWTQAGIKDVGTRFAEAAMMGVTVLAASGDDGSNCQISDGHAHVVYPASDPRVLACGGTAVHVASAQSSFTETTWNTDGVTGGGVSDVFPPAWQAAADVPASVNDGHAGCGVPDVAGNADPASGYLLVVNGASYGPVGGTSAAAPLYAALVALLNADMGRRAGFLNPALYALAGSPVFRDIADRRTNATGGAPGYKSRAGWDACTGLGSIDGNALLKSLS